MKTLSQRINEKFNEAKYSTRGEIEDRQEAINKKIKRIKSKSFLNRGEENNYKAKHLKPLQDELIELSDLWGKVGN